MVKLNSELDKINTTITLSLGTKNRLREQKGSLSYENYINYLLRMRNKVSHGDNYVELQKLKRKTVTYSFQIYKIIFSYNEYNNSPNYLFDIKIDYVREPQLGEKITFAEFLDGKKHHEFNVGYHVGYIIYFELLSFAIQKEIEPLFKHKGRFEDYYSWEKEFELFELSKNAFESDVMEKLYEYKRGEPYND